MVEQVARTTKPNGRANGKDPPPAEIALVSMAEIEPRPIDWLWPGRLAKRKLTLITGEPDLGKSQIGLDAIARITTGRPWPDEAGGRAPLGNCLVLSAEDAADDVLRPRLEAAGADLARAHTIKSVVTRDHDGKAHAAVLSLQRDLEQLGESIAAIGGISLIVVDPLNAYFGDQVDTHKTAAVRSVLAQLDGFANKNDIAILGIMHPPKTVAGGKAINAVTGSLAFVAAARMAFLVTADPADQDRRLMLGIKNNLGSKASGLAYRIATKIVTRNIVAPYLVWGSTPINLTANEALAVANEAAKTRGDSMRQAKQFLRDLLEEGPVAATDAVEKAEAEGINNKTLQRARKTLGVIAEKDKAFQGRWMWRLP
jgi:putative DNA primase/helicase